MAPGKRDRWWGNVEIVSFVSFSLNGDPAAISTFDRIVASLAPVDEQLLVTGSQRSDNQKIVCVHSARRRRGI
jgi:hypothetical protein